ncbi:hypothetical protein PAHAL_8G199900 [Panicum hallii]|uniref:Uncharacterized protein n=1 Tax=Panicum hallii TaxID=206008 RepID=A0A2T8I9J6_9POAL|nr:UPF0481 protein At3g47200-like [Panicum hallii]XP_025828510.1 UPF0481 protein At3g47200-like [Panicum hallii]PVH34344.1 hypothetical protein PAHAL_8G199900 [Panicum hallii]
MMNKESTARVQENDTLCSRWVEEMEELLPGTDLLVEKARWSKPSIYRVPEWIKGMMTNNTSAYRPRLVSLGPFHHGEPDLLPMEEHKRRAVLHLVKRSGKPLRDFVAAVEMVADELLDAYQGLDEKWRESSRDRFVQMMVMDGCFLLELMEATKPLGSSVKEDEVINTINTNPHCFSIEIFRTRQSPRAAAVSLSSAPVKDDQWEDYAPNDPVFSAHANHILWPGIRSDVIALENQLPLLVLQRLLAVERGTTPEPAEINMAVVRYLYYCSCEGTPTGKLGLHPLDILHRSMCAPQPDAQHQGGDSASFEEDCMPSAVELREARVLFKSSNTHLIDAITFRNGVLSMPEFKAYGDTENLYLNLFAFEQLHPDTGYELLSYMFFMVGLIESNRDVALLRSRGIIRNMRSSDKELVEMFSVLGRATLMHPSSKLNGVLREVKAHCKKRRNKWRANFVHTYLSSPWVFISLIAAVILLMATLLQTVYAILPFYSKVKPEV